MIDFKTVNKSWALFLDRDGVINKEVLGEYVLHTSQFFFYDETLSALEILNKIFGTIVIVTNQKGVGRGAMSSGDLDEIHDNMMKEVIISGGRIDKIYFATDLDNDSPYRKPQHGMALHAKEDFSHIDFSKSMMAGNKITDMEFGRNAGMSTVFIATTNPETEFPNALIDAKFISLFEFAQQFPH